MEHTKLKPDEKRKGEMKSLQFTNMGIKILNFKHVGLNILVLFILLTVVESSGEITGPQREVASIYNDNFATPASRPQYFIEVYRCVKDEFGKCFSNPEQWYPVPKKTEEIEILVPDTTNNDRDSSDKKKFYKYVVYNHTICKCGNLTYRNRKLYKTITNNKVSEVYFSASYSKNPVNLLRLCDVCNSPQPRYNLTHGHENVLPQFKYLAYQQCLPGCVVKSGKTFNVTITFPSNQAKIVNLTNDTSCKAYDGNL